MPKNNNKEPILLKYINTETQKLIKQTPIQNFSSEQPPHKKQCIRHHHDSDRGEENIPPNNQTTGKASPQSLIDLSFSTDSESDTSSLDLSKQASLIGKSDTASEITQNTHKITNALQTPLLSRNTSITSIGTSTSSIQNHFVENFTHLSSERLIKKHSLYVNMTNKEKSRYKEEILGRSEIVKRLIEKLKTEVAKLQEEIRENNHFLATQTSFEGDAMIELSHIVANEKKITYLQKEIENLENERINLYGIKMRLKIDDSLKPEHLKAARDGKSQPSIASFFARDIPASNFQQSLDANKHSGTL